MPTSERTARRVQSLSDKVRGAWGLIVLASLTHSAYVVYPYAKEGYAATRGLTVIGALPAIDEASDIAPYIAAYSSQLVLEQKKSIPIPPHPPKEKGMGYSDEDRINIEYLVEENQ